MKEYKYEGEKFQIQQVGECEIKISDIQNTVSITAKGARFKVHSITEGGGWTLDSPSEALPYACRELLAKRRFPEVEDACKALSQFYDNLE